MIMAIICKETATLMIVQCLPKLFFFARKAATNTPIISDAWKARFMVLKIFTSKVIIVL